MKMQCQNCSEYAVWVYMPAEHEGYFCDNCVPRGCSCNIDPGTELEDTDEHGRLFPCCEYLFEPKGFDNEN